TSLCISFTQWSIDVTCTASAPPLLLPLPSSLLSPLLDRWRLLSLLLDRSLLLSLLLDLLSLHRRSFSFNDLFILSLALINCSSLLFSSFFFS
ncbi:hypothetical protein PMAYCL1PPCAC_04184, partial [Pristionchus mayeri]